MKNNAPPPKKKIKKARSAPAPGKLSFENKANSENVKSVRKSSVEKS